MEPQKAPESNSDPEKEEQSWRNYANIIKLYQKAIIIKTTSYCYKSRHIDQCNGTENPEINPQLCSQLILDRGSKPIQWAKDSLFNKWYWEIWTDTCRKMKLDNFLTPYARINSKWIKDLNVRPQTIKIAEENTGNKLSDIAQRNILSDVSPQARETKNKQMGLHRTKTFLQSKRNHQQNKRAAYRMGEHIHVTCT